MKFFGFIKFRWILFVVILDRIDDMVKAGMYPNKVSSQEVKFFVLFLYAILVALCISLLASLLTSFINKIHINLAIREISKK